MRNILCYVGLLLLIFSCKNNDVDTSLSTLKKSDGSEFSYILPSIQVKNTMTLEEALQKRRSRRDFIDKAISTEQLSQLLWAAYGVTERRYNIDLRTAPSAGGLYPLEIYVLVGNVKDVESGVYKYFPSENKIVRVIAQDMRTQLCEAALGQKMIQTAPISIFYSAVFNRNTDKYGARGRERYVCMDLGHSAQNVYLQAEALHMGTCAIGAFIDDKVKEILQLPENEEPLYIMPIGYYYANSIQ